VQLKKREGKGKGDQVTIPPIKIDRNQGYKNLPRPIEERSWKGPTCLGDLATREATLSADLISEKGGRDRGNLVLVSVLRINGGKASARRVPEGKKLST